MRHKMTQIVQLTFSTNADLMPTANSLSPPPNQPTGPAYIPRSNNSEHDV